jgi:hypothetical protein
MTTTVDIITEEITLDIGDDCTTVDIVEVESFVLEFDGVLEGPQGPPGPPGGASVVYPAGESLGAGRVVIIESGQAVYFQPGDATHQGRAYGITTASAIAGANATIQIIGEVENAAFTFDPDAILYVYNNGIIVDTDPDLLVTQVAGVSTTDEKMRIDFSISILKA